MKFSSNYYALIETFEGFRSKAYKCPAGVWTIGFGTTKGVKPGMVVTENVAHELLVEDSRKIEYQLNNMGIMFSQNQFDALGSFIYNIGFGKFQSSTLCKRIKLNRNDKEIEHLWKQWKYAKGKVLQGLVKRREYEAALYFGRVLIK